MAMTLTDQVRFPVVGCRWSRRSEREGPPTFRPAREITLGCHSFSITLNLSPSFLSPFLTFISNLPSAKHSRCAAVLSILHYAFFISLSPSSSVLGHFTSALFRRHPCYSRKWLFIADGNAALTEWSRWRRHPFLPSSLFPGKKHCHSEEKGSAPLRPSQRQFVTRQQSRPVLPTSLLRLSFPSPPRIQSPTE